MKEMKVNLRRIRRARDISQSSLAEDLVLSQDYISRIENGRYCPSVFLALELAQALEVSVEELFEISEIPESPSQSFDAENEY